MTHTQNPWRRASQTLGKNLQLLLCTQCDCQVCALFRDGDREQDSGSQEITGLEGSQTDNLVITDQGYHGGAHTAVSSTEKLSRRWSWNGFLEERKDLQVRMIHTTGLQEARRTLKSLECGVLRRQQVF